MRYRIPSSSSGASASAAETDATDSCSSQCFSSRLTLLDGSKEQPHAALTRRAVNVSCEPFDRANEAFLQKFGPLMQESQQFVIFLARIASQRTASLRLLARLQPMRPICCTIAAVSSIETLECM